MSRLILFILAYGVWCLLTWAPSQEELIAGLPLALIVALLTGDLFVARPALLLDPRRYWYFVFGYLPILLWECLKANFDVALRVLNPNLPIQPGIVEVRTNLKSETALTFLANSITLTPGTMSVDLDRDAGKLYIHWIYVKTTDTDEATREIAGRFEKILAKVFE